METCIKTKATEPLSPSTTSLSSLESNLLHSWLMSLIVILYKVSQFSIYFTLGFNNFCCYSGQSCSQSTICIQEGPQSASQIFLSYLIFVLVNFPLPSIFKFFKFVYSVVQTCSSYWLILYAICLLASKFDSSHLYIAFELDY